MKKKDILNRKIITPLLRHMSNPKIFFQHTTKKASFFFLYASCHWQYHTCVLKKNRGNKKKFNKRNRKRRREKIFLIEKWTFFLLSIFQFGRQEHGRRCKASWFKNMDMWFKSASNSVRVVHSSEWIMEQNVKHATQKIRTVIN